MGDKKRIFIPQLNSLRFFAAIAVVIFHFGRWSFPFDGRLNTYALGMNLAVSFFFVLSGFIMVTVYEKMKDFSWKEALSFYSKRVMRIVPLYFIALSAVSLEYIFLSGVSLERFSVSHLIESIFFLQAWNPADALVLNFPGWSLSVEMFLYLLFPLIFAFLVSRKNILRDIFVFWIISNFLLLLFVGAAGHGNQITDSFIKYFPLFHLNQFLVGMAAGWYYLKGFKMSNGIFLLALGGLLAYLPFASEGFFGFSNHDGLLAPLFALLILGAASSTSIIKRILSFKLLVGGGEASYGIYILQFPVYLAIYELYKVLNIYGYLGEEGRFYVYLLILIGISFLSAKTIEPRFKFKKKEALRPL